MSKTNIVEVNIVNNTTFTFTFASVHFEQGGLAEGEEWPQTIQPGNELNVKCTGVHKGCSGWVAYKSGKSYPYPSKLYFAFANRAENKVGVGQTPEAWNKMKPHKLPVQEVYPEYDRSGKYMTVNISSTNGETNHALWVINKVDTTADIPIHKVEDVKKLYASIKEDGVGMYYKLRSSDKSIYSHFKGVGALKDKLIFTHTNIAPVTGGNGLYLIGNKIAPNKDGAVIEAVYETVHDPAWGHPGGGQVCGNYMAVGIQKSDDSGYSEIQIYDIRNTQVNREMKLVTSIPKGGGINGVGMTKQAGKDGRYIIICSQGEKLNVYRSNQSNMSSDMTFTCLTYVCAGVKPLNHIHGGAGLGLITQEDGKLFFIGMHASDDGPSTLNLYELTIENDNATYERVANEKTLSTHSSVTDSNFSKTSFRWGKGLSITSPDSIEIYATDRNILKDSTFSMVTWKGGILGTPHQVTNVKQTYADNILHVSWEAPSDAKYLYYVRVLYKTRGKVISRKECYTTACDFNIDSDLSPSKEGRMLLASVSAAIVGNEYSSAKKSDNQPGPSEIEDVHIPYTDAETPNYRLGQAKIETLSYDNIDGILTGTWKVPRPLRKDPMKEPTGYDYQILDPDGNVVKSGSETGTGVISIQTEKSTIKSNYYQAQIRATGQDEVIPGEWSVAKGFAIYRFPPVSSNLNNAPKGSVGYFLIGDIEAQVNNQVTFWGSNWINNNKLSGSVSSSLSSFCGYVFANERILGGISQGAYNPEYNSGVEIQVGETYSMPVISTFTNGTDTGLANHFVATQSNVVMIVDVKVDYFQDDRSKPNEGTGTIVSILWEMES